MERRKIPIAEEVEKRKKKEKNLSSAERINQQGNVIASEHIFSMLSLTCLGMKSYLHLRWRFKMSQKPFLATVVRLITSDLCDSGLKLESHPLSPWRAETQNAQKTMVLA